MLNAIYSLLIGELLESSRSFGDGTIGPVKSVLQTTQHYYFEFILRLSTMYLNRSSGPGENFELYRISVYGGSTVISFSISPGPPPPLH